MRSSKLASVFTGWLAVEFEGASSAAGRRSRDDAPLWTDRRALTDGSGASLWYTRAVVVYREATFSN